MIKKIWILFILVVSMAGLVACQEPLNINITYGMSDDQQHVRQDLKLDEYYKGQTISWTSSNESVISNTGVVKRPGADQQDIEVTLTATVSEGSKTFKLTVIKLTGDDFYDQYPSVNDIDHVFEEISYETLMGLFNSNEHHIVLLGWPTCSWCIEYVYYYNMLAKQEGIEKILYYNHRDIRNDTEEIDGRIILSDAFNAFVGLIDQSLISTHPSDPETPWIYSPTLLVFKEGTVTDTLGGAIAGHVAYDARLNEAQKMMLIFEIVELYNSYKN